MQGRGLPSWSNRCANDWPRLPGLGSDGASSLFLCGSSSGRSLIRSLQPFSLLLPCFFFSSVLTKRAKLSLYVSNDRLDLIPYLMDCFSHFLGGTCPLHLKGTVNFQFTEIPIYSLKEIDDGLFLSEHTTQASFCIAALKQIDKKRDKEKQGSYQNAECFWLHRDVHGFSPKQ